MPPSRGPMAWKHRNFVLVACVCLALATLALYSRAVHNPFMHVDDQSYVTENLHVQAGVGWQTLAWALTATEAENWHPLTWISHALDYQLYGLNPAGHHATNIVLHALNAVLLFLVLFRATGAGGRSLLVAALFALHPLNVESVAWIAERKNILSTLFFLLALAAYGWYARKPDLKRYLAVVALFALGLAAKPMVITLPFVLLLLDYWPLERIRGWDAASLSTLRGAKSRQKTRVQGELPRKFFVHLNSHSRAWYLKNCHSWLFALAARQSRSLPSEPMPFRPSRYIHLLAGSKTRSTPTPPTYGRHSGRRGLPFYIRIRAMAALRGC